MRRRKGETWTCPRHVSCRAEAKERTLGKIGTATRTAEGSDYATVLDGNAALGGQGIVLSVEEFFSALAGPSSTPQQGIEGFQGKSDPVEVLTYYLDEDQEEREDHTEPWGIQQKSHGVRVMFTSRFPSAEGSPMLPVIPHARHAASVPEIFAKNARIRVVAGSYGGVTIPPPLSDFLLLDVRIRSGLEAELDLPGQLASMVYLLEGVAIFGKSDSSVKSTAYIGEGHSLHLPAMGRVGCTLHVKTHPWEDARFLLLAEESGEGEL